MSAKSEASSFVAADQTITQNRIYHKTHYLALGLVPVALVAHPSALSMPVDVALSIVLPLHAHVSEEVIPVKQPSELTIMTTDWHELDFY